MVIVHSIVSDFPALINSFFLFVFVWFSRKYIKKAAEGLPLAANMCYNRFILTSQGMIMITVYLLATLLIAFFLIKNIVANGHFKARSEGALVVFRGETRVRRISRIVFIIAFVLMIGVLLFYLFTSDQLDLLQLAILVCLILCFALFGFVPYSPGKWLVSAEGVYVYNQDRFIPFDELIACRIVGEGKRSYLQLDLIKQDSDRLKKGTYLLQIPAEKARDTADMIRDFITLEDKARARRRRERLSGE